MPQSSLKRKWDSTLDPVAVLRLLDEASKDPSKDMATTVQTLKSLAQAAVDASNVGVVTWLLSFSSHKLIEQL